MRALTEEMALEAIHIYATRDVDKNRVTLEDACELMGFSVFTLFENMRRSEKLATAYSLARESQANVYADRLASLADKVEAGKLDPNAARVASANLQWLAARGDKSRFSEHSTSETRQVHEIDFSGLSDAALEEVTLLLEGKAAKGE